MQVEWRLGGRDVAGPWLPHQEILADYPYLEENDIWHLSLTPLGALKSTSYR